MLPSPDEDDLFGSDNLFGSTLATKHTTPSPKSKTAEEGLKKERETAPSIFDDHGGDLFQKVKPRSAKKAKASSFLEEEDDEEDIFGMGKSSTPTAAVSKDTGSSSTKQDIFQVG